jgi:subtilisin family serine protease
MYHSGWRGHPVIGGNRRHTVWEAVMTVTDRQYSVGTVEHNPRKSELFSAAGKKSGHGIIAWLPAPAYEMRAAPPWPEAQANSAPSHRRPVIALLDTGVRRHPWLPEGGGPPFVLRAEDRGWHSLIPDEDEDEPGPDADYRSHWGHATFIAGLIRLAAPTAQVLSMRVMDGHGKVSEDTAARALNWLVDNFELVGGVDIVLMAFGRHDDPGHADTEKLRAPIGKLSDRGVRIVASAGNDGTERPVYPAAFATDPELSCGSRRSVVSVGALATPTERAPYSNSGPWVTAWYPGTNVISIMPLTTKSPDNDTPAFDPAAPAHGAGYAWWSGTSFAAATAAGELAACR